MVYGYGYAVRIEREHLFRLCKRLKIFVGAELSRCKLLHLIKRCFFICTFLSFTFEFPALLKTFL